MKLNSIKNWMLLIITISCGVLDKPVFADSQSDAAWEKPYKQGTVALDKGEYWIAKPKLHEALIAARSFDPGDIRLAKSLSELGRLYTIRGRFAEAEPYLEEALIVKQRALGLDSDEFIPCVGSLAKFQLLYGSASKADALADEILFLIDGKMKDPNFGIRTKVKFVKDKPLEGFAGMADPVTRSPILDWAITCDDIGTLYRQRNNFEMAKKMFDAAIVVKATVVGKQHLSLASTYESLGMVAMEKQDFPAAENYFKDSLEITERILPCESPEVYSRLDKLARCYIKENKFKDAEDLYLRAQGFWDKQPSRYGEECRAVFALGCLYADQRNFGAAAPVLARALHMAEKINGPESISLVPYLRKYAYVLYYIGQRPRQEQFRGRSDTIFGETH